jgi:hypothetical protein
MNIMKKSDIKYLVLIVLSGFCIVYLFSTGIHNPKRTVSLRGDYNPYKYYDMYFQPFVIKKDTSEALNSDKLNLLFVMNRKNEEFLDFIENINKGNIYKNVEISIVSNVISKSRKHILIYKYDYSVYKKQFGLGEFDDMTIFIDRDNKIKYMEFYLLQDYEIIKLLERWK